MTDILFSPRVKETSNTTGTGTLDLAGAVTGFRTFVAGIATTNLCPYTLLDGNGTNWEIGIGTVTDAAPDTLARTTVILNDAGTSTAITLSTSTPHTVFNSWDDVRSRASERHSKAFEEGDGLGDPDLLTDQFVREVQRIIRINMILVVGYDYVSFLGYNRIPPQHGVRPLMIRRSCRIGFQWRIED